MNEHLKALKDNLEKEKALKKHKKEHHIDPWRATGQTTRALFDLASRYPHGKFIFITHCSAMARNCLRKFIKMQVDTGAPIKVNNSQMIVKLQSAEYHFKVDSQRLRETIHPTDTVIEDHFAQRQRSDNNTLGRWW